MRAFLSTPHRPWFKCAALLGTLPALLAAPAGAQAVVLKNVPPGLVLRAMGWDRGAALPPGVTQISVRPQDNALDVAATPDGFSYVRQVAQALDVVPRRVSLKVSLVQLSDVQMVEHGLAAAMPASLTVWADDGVPGLRARAAARAAFVRGLAAPTALVTTANNATVALTLSPPGVRSVTLTLTPRVNSDASVTLDVRARVAAEFSGAVGPGGVTGGAPTVTLERTRTVAGGEPVLLGDRLFDARSDARNDLLIVVTPTLPADQPEGDTPPGRR